RCAEGTIDQCGVAGITYCSKCTTAMGRSDAWCERLTIPKHIAKVYTDGMRSQLKINEATL
ncbi:7-cyano-7-deazaguanine synthase 2, partial [Clarias magur]